MDALGKKDLGTYVAVAGGLRIAHSGMLLLGGLFLGALLIGTGAATGDPVAFKILGVTGAVLSGAMFILALPSLVAGIGLLARASWSRVMALVLSGFDLIFFPIGTLLGVYTIFVLLQRVAVEEFGPCCAIEETRAQIAT
jgi:hypothetical protein